MTADEYLRAILKRERVDTGILSPVRIVHSRLKPSIDKWAGQSLVSMAASGSFAKGTAVTSGTDIDLFLSLSSSTPETLKVIYNTLHNRLKEDGYFPRLQNVSIGVKVGGYDVDLVPAKRQDQYSHSHSLYRRRADTWTKTNITTHINTVQQSNRLEEIMILKTWRNQMGLEFPSFYLELVAIRACHGRTIGNLAANVSHTFEYIRDNIETAVFIDPANANNRISSDLNATEKRSLKLAAINARTAQTWGKIVV